MSRFTVKFEQVKENLYTAEIDADNYEQAMDILEENPFKYVKGGEDNPDESKVVDWHVTKVKQGKNNTVYKDYKKIQVLYL